MSEVVKEVLQGRLRATAIVRMLSTLRAVRACERLQAVSAGGGVHEGYDSGFSDFPDGCSCGARKR